MRSRSYICILCLLGLLLLPGCRQEHTDPAFALPTLQSTPVQILYGEKTVTGLLSFGNGEPFRLEITSPGTLQGLTVTDGSSRDRFCFAYRTLYREDILLPETSPVSLLYRAMQAGADGPEALLTHGYTCTPEQGLITRIFLPKENFCVSFLM